LRTIAQHLNTERAPSPRRKGWSSSALQAMLQNPIYQGTYLWNRSEWIKEHETGRRRRFERPESEWLRREMPELAIVSPELWARVELLRMERTTGYPRRADRRLTGRARACHKVVSRHLLSGLLKCAECGGAFFALRRESSYGCGWRRDRGKAVCGNRLRATPRTGHERLFDAFSRAGASLWGRTRRAFWFEGCSAWNYECPRSLAPRPFVTVVEGG